MNRAWAAGMLLLRFGRAVLVSGLQTVAVILKAGRAGGQPPSVALLRVGFAPMSKTGAALLGCMASLTPGTTTIDIDIDMARQELLLHVLDALRCTSALRCRQPLGAEAAVSVHRAPSAGQ